MTKEQLHGLIEEGKGNLSNVTQICAMQGSDVLYSDSFRGFGTEDAANVNSVTKGVLGLLTGIALDRGDIKNTQQKVTEFFPGYEVKRGEKTIYDVTLRHLLTMTAPYKFRSEPWKKVCTSPDWTKAALDLLGGKKGITGDFKYSTLGIQIMVGVIEAATGMRCLELANKYLFAPLGIPEHKPHTDSSKEDQFNFLMNKDPRINEWYCEPAGSVTGGWGLTLSACDMAKIGQLVIGKGCYEGKQVLSEKAMAEVLGPYKKLGRQFGNMSYGYLWYKPHDDREVYAAIGDGGNIIYADRESGISVGMTGTFKPRIFDRVQFIEENVLAAVRL